MRKNDPIKQENFEKITNYIISRISELRVRANLSARELSLQADLNDSYINGLETRKNFLPSLEALLSIIEVCGSTPIEFFYYSLDSYKQDEELIDLLKSTTPSEKR